MALQWGSADLTWGADALAWGLATDFYWSADGLYWSTDGLYWNVSVTPVPPSSGAGGGAGGAGTTQRLKKWWSSHKKEPRRKDSVIEYAEIVAQAFSEATAEDAGKLAVRAKTLERLISESDYKIAYLTDMAVKLREAAIKAAKAESERIRQEQIAISAEIAHRIEMELRDEEETILLLLM